MQNLSLKVGALLCLSCLPARAATTPSSAPSSFQCESVFEPGSADVSQMRWQKCIEDARANGLAIESVTVSGAATPPGQPEQNHQLAQERSEALRDTFRGLLPSVPVEAQNRGIVTYKGRNAIVVLQGTRTATNAALTTFQEEAPPPSPAATPQPPADERLASLGNPPAAAPMRSRSSNVQARVAVRAGADRDWNNDQRSPGVVGLDLTALPTVAASRSLRLEAGALAEQHISHDLEDTTGLYGVGGVGYRRGGFVAGVRGLAGAILTSSNGEFDGGGEGRLGFENNQLSIFFGMGRTKAWTRFGWDLGIIF